jgi:DNA uptake protein ComE-like DNA-binding protein
MFRISKAFNLCCLVLLIGSASCNSTSSRDRQQRDAKTREEAAKATERIKPELKEAGKELGQAARQAAEDARAAAQGVQEGWSHDHTHPLNLNSASESELTTLPGITRADARQIIRRRPYHSKEELVSRGILSRQDYNSIRDDVSTE